MDLRKSWRTIAASLVGVSLLTVASISFAGAQQQHRPATALQAQLQQRRATSGKGDGVKLAA